MAAQAGTFEFIEARIRSEARGTEFGRDFEWLCKWDLENAALPWRFSQDIELHASTQVVYSPLS